jgi:hypothetical protein
MRFKIIRNKIGKKVAKSVQMGQFGEERVRENLLEA